VLNRGIIRLRKLLGQDKISAPIQTVHVPAVCQRWRRSRLTQTCRPHLFPNSSSPSNQPNALPPKFPYPCMHYTPINTHSGMPTYYGGPLRHGGSATVETRRFRLPARYCFLSLVRSLLSEMVAIAEVTHTGSWPNAHEQKQKTKLLPPSSDSRVCVRFAYCRKPGIARFLCAIFKCDISQRQFGPVVTDIIIILILLITAIQHYHLRNDLRALSSRLVVLQPTRQLGQEERLFLAREIQRGTSCPDPSAPRVPR
jgi:hypothetical protein